MTSTRRGALDEADLLVTRNLIGGAWIEGRGEPIKIEDPYTLDSFAEVPNLGEDEAKRAVDVAEAAFPAWAARPAKERATILRRWYELLIAHRDDVARLITLENGKTFREAQGEFDYGAGFMEFYADEATRALGETIPAPVPGRRLYAEREPVGVCAAITPWNFPLAMLTRKVGPALAAGPFAVDQVAGNQQIPFVERPALAARHLSSSRFGLVTGAPPSNRCSNRR